MNTIHPVGTKVQSSSYDSSISGTIVAHTVVESTLMYIVKLNKGFYSEERNTYVSLLVMAADGVVPATEPNWHTV